MTYDKMFTDNKIDAFVFLGESNRYYFTRMETSFGAVVLTKKRNYFITDFRYEFAAREKLDDYEIVIATYADLYDKIAAIVFDCGAKTVGVEQSASYADYTALKAALKGAKLKPADEIISAKRAIKTDEEIELIIKSQRIAETALLKAIASAKPDITERDLMAEINYEMIKGGADTYSFETIVAFGANTAKPHHHPSDKKLEKDDFILVDMGAKKDGYCSDMTRTFCLGEPTPELLRIYETVKEAQEYAIKYIKAGMTCKDADSLAREYITANGYGENFGHSFGHGVGIDIHEAPNVSKNSEVVLQPNMVITAEPGIYVAGIGGVRIEDMLVVTSNGVNDITSYDKNLEP